MRIDWVIPCRFAEALGAGANIIGAGIDTAQVAEFPAEVGFVLIARIVGLEHEMVDEHHLTLQLQDDQMGVLGDADIPFTPALNPQRLEGWEQTTYLIGVHQFTVEREGTYTLDVRLDGGSDHRTMKQVPFRVQQQQ